MIGEQDWHSGESTCLPSMQPGFDSRTWHHMWAGQEKNFEIQLPSGPVHFSFQLPPLKYYLPNRRRENNVHALSTTLAFYLNWTMMKRNAECLCFSLPS